VGDAARMTRRCVGAILAGGRATRFGGALKGLETVGGRRMVDVVAGVLAASADEVMLVANAPEAGRWLERVRVVPDVIVGAGSLGGVHAALVHAAPHDVIVVAWDMPFVPAALLRALRQRGEEGGATAVLPRGPARRDGLPDGEPLCAWYAGSCLTSAAALLDAGERRAAALASAARAVLLDPDPFGDPARMFGNVNTPDDLARARGLAEP
jgi:molybdenum cofactor guanylyltransferase